MVDKLKIHLYQLLSDELKLAIVSLKYIPFMHRGLNNIRKKFQRDIKLHNDLVSFWIITIFLQFFQLFCICQTQAIKTIKMQLRFLKIPTIQSLCIWAKNLGKIFHLMSCIHFFFRFFYLRVKCPLRSN